MALKLSFSIEAVTSALSPIKRTQSALKALQAQSAQIESYQQARGALLDNAAALRRAKEELKATKAAYAAASKPTATLSEKIKQANLAVTEARGRLKRQQEALNNLRTSLDRAGIGTSGLAARQRELQARIASTTSSLARQTVWSGRLGSGWSMVTGAFRTGARIVGVFGRAFGWVGLAITGITQLGRAVAGIVAPIINTGAAFEKYNVMLAGIEGSSSKGQKAMAWITEFAEKTPMALDDVTSAFIQMRNFGLDPTDGSMQALVDMNARMGGSSQKLQGMILALGQAWGKGSLQGNDILQLINAGVPVWDLLSKMTGKNVQELHKLSSQGWLGRDAIKGLIGEMGKLSKGAGLAQMKTWNGMISTLGDQWTRFKKMIADSGAFSYFKEQLAGVISKIDEMTASGELKTWAENIGGALVDIAKFTKGAFAVAIATGKVLGVVFKVVGAIVKAVLWPFKELWELISLIYTKLIEVFDKLTGVGLGNVIGRTTAALMAGLGSEDAKAALDTESGAGTQRTLLDVLMDQKTMLAKQQKSAVKMDVTFHQDRPPTVRTEADKGVDVNTLVGRNLAGVM